MNGNKVFFITIRNKNCSKEEIFTQNQEREQKTRTIFISLTFFFFPFLKFFLHSKCSERAESSSRPEEAFVGGGGQAAVARKASRPRLLDRCRRTKVTLRQKKKKKKELGAMKCSSFFVVFCFSFCTTKTFSNVFSVLAVILLFLSELPEPLLTYKLYDQFIRTAGTKQKKKRRRNRKLMHFISFLLAIDDDELRVACWHLLVHRLPLRNFALFSYLLSAFAR